MGCWLEKGMKSGMVYGTRFLLFWIQEHAIERRKPGSSSGARMIGALFAAQPLFPSTRRAGLKNWYNMQGDHNPRLEGLVRKSVVYTGCDLTL
jgi:hypothetical protein